MTKISASVELRRGKQKIWMWVFIAMFALPEILWSPVVNFVYAFLRGDNASVILRNNFLVQPDYRKLAIFIIFLQCLGSLLSLISIYKTSIKLVYKILLSILFFIFFVLSLGVLYILVATVNINLVM